MNETPSDRRLEELEEEWRRRPTPQLSLQLSEEYRRRDRLLQALQVLEEEARRHPGHLSAQVALGKLRLEAGRLEDALYSFEQVVAKDPTHLVANRQLVGLYLTAGEEQKARDRLDLYSLLNSGDPEIEVLEARFSKAAAGAAEGAGPVLEDRGEDGDTGPEPREASREELPRRELEEAPRPPERVAAGLEDPRRTGLEDGAARSGEEVFQGLWQGLDLDTYWDYLGVEQIFPIEPPRLVDAAGPGGEEPTATLGALYLEQGHWSEAERIFSRVLAEDPGNKRALEGLRAARRAGGERLSARELLGDVERLEELSAGERKTLLLQRYLMRLRGHGMETRH